MIEAASGITLGDGIAALAGLRGTARAVATRPTAAVQPVPAIVGGPGGRCSDGDCNDTAEISGEARSLADRSGSGSPATLAGSAFAALEPGRLLDVTA